MGHWVPGMQKPFTVKDQKKRKHRNKVAAKSRKKNRR
jgi:hypothetical protein